MGSFNNSVVEGIQAQLDSEAFNEKLTEEQLKGLEQELDALRRQIVDDLGQADHDYMKQIIRLNRYCEIMGRLLIHVSLSPISWLMGVAFLSAAKIIENMEIGHNIMHGQYDWTGDPKLASQDYEWDTVCDSDSWRHTHNFEHHTYTNILGKDRDYGYALLRLTHDEEWKPHHLIQFIPYLGLSFLFQWGVGLHELEVDKLKSGEKTLRDKIPFLKAFAKKASKQVAKDYVLFPLLAGPMAPKVFAGNLMANGVRNLWTSTVIFCGHFTEDSRTFTEQECENESKGHWYYRQILGSGNFSGKRWLHMMTGHLSYQIEHHLFPDIPSHRYQEMGPEVERICKKYNIPYNTGSFSKQYFTVLKRILVHSFPEGFDPGSILKRKRAKSAAYAVTS